MRLLWLLFRLGVQRQELVTEGFLHSSWWHHLLRKDFRTCHNLTTTTTPISTLPRRLWKNPVNSHYSFIHSFIKYLMCIWARHWLYGGLITWVMSSWGRLPLNISTQIYNYVLEKKRKWCHEVEQLRPTLNWVANKGFSKKVLLKVNT